MVVVHPAGPVAPVTPAQAQPTPVAQLPSGGAPVPASVLPGEAQRGAAPANTNVTPFGPPLSARPPLQGPANSGQAIILQTILDNLPPLVLGGFGVAQALNQILGVVTGKP